MILIYSFMGHSLRPDNLTITPDFVISDGTHNTGYVLVSATGGVASWKNTFNLPGFQTKHYIGISIHSMNPLILIQLLNINGLLLELQEVQQVHMMDWLILIIF